MTKTFDFIIQEMNGTDIVESLKLLREAEKCALLVRSAQMLRTLAQGMMDDTDGDMQEMTRHCRDMLAAKPMEGLTPTVMAERMKRIAALPKSHLINDEGRVYMARIDNPLGDGSVWCALDISETFRKALEINRQERAV